MTRSMAGQDLCSARPLLRLVGRQRCTLVAYWTSSGREFATLLRLWDLVKLSDPIWLASVSLVLASYTCIHGVFGDLTFAIGQVRFQLPRRSKGAVQQSFCSRAPFSFLLQLLSPPGDLGAQIGPRCGYWLPRASVSAWGLVDGH